MQHWGWLVSRWSSHSSRSPQPKAPQATDVGIINLQPIFNYQVGGGRSLSLGNSAVIYDTEQARWASLNLGVNYGQIVTFAGH